jgi:TetR/AcrR family fatty acid metabolism transcriptional regulator
MTPKIVDKDAKKEEILHAAMQVFAKKGVVKTKMVDIAEFAGIGKGTIYEYFRSKEEIFIAAFHSFFSHMEKGIVEAMNATEDPIEKLKNLVEVSFSNVMEAGAEFHSIMMDFWAEGIRKKDDQVLQMLDLNYIYSEYRKLITEILSDGIKKGVFRKIDTHVISSMFIAALDGIYLQYILDNSLFDLKEISKVLLDGFLNGIRR